jgi:hypothetical protein
MSKSGRERDWRRIAPVLDAGLWCGLQEYTLEEDRVERRAS